MADKKDERFSSSIYKSLALPEKEETEKRKVLHIFNLGGYYYGLAYFEQAKRDYTEALRIFKEVGFQCWRGKSLWYSRQRLSQSRRF